MDLESIMSHELQESISIDRLFPRRSRLDDCGGEIINSELLRHTTDFFKKHFESRQKALLVFCREGDGCRTVAEGQTHDEALHIDRMTIFDDFHRPEIHLRLTRRVLQSFMPCVVFLFACHMPALDEIADRSIRALESVRHQRFINLFIRSSQLFLKHLILGQPILDHLAPFRSVHHAPLGANGFTRQLS